MIVENQKKKKNEINVLMPSIVLRALSANLMNQPRLEVNQMMQKMLE